MTLLDRGMTLEHITVFDNSIIACGSNDNLELASASFCFSFDGVTGTLTGRYALLWESTTAVTTVLDARGILRLLLSSVVGNPQVPPAMQMKRRGSVMLRCYLMLC